jgi:8-oxo-dGTP pyrophosphatase MutT (NUDIX family)
MAPPEEAKQPAPQGEQPAKRTRRRRRRKRKPAAANQPADQQRRGGASTAGSAPTAKTSKAGKTAKTKRAGGRRRKPAAQSAKSGAQKGAQRKSGQRGGSRRKGAAKRKAARQRPKIPTTREVSAGGVLYRRGDEGIEVVLASRRTRRGQLAWGLAKGGIEIGETKEVAAIREVREETGLTAEIEADLGDTKYMYVWDDIRIRKTVHFFLMRHTGGDVEDRDDEMEEIRWFPLERAIKRAAYRGERDMLVKASELLR